MVVRIFVQLPKNTFFHLHDLTKKSKNIFYIFYLYFFLIYSLLIGFVYFTFVRTNLLRKKIEDLLMQKVYLKSALNFKDFLKIIFFHIILYLNAQLQF